jgi:membrane-bound metal-dependent hydrolase YbcI (DUF457 family)
MFVGHFGLGFGAKPAAPAVSLGTLFLACQFADLLWPTLVLLGIEHVEIRPGATAMTPLDFVSYPYSHSLLMLVVWGLVVGGVYAVARRSRLRAAVTLALLVVSHWVLDVVTHRRDMPLTPTCAGRVGLELWASIPGTLAVELLIFAAGVVLYARATTARDRVGSIGLWSLVAFLLGVYVAAIVGPPPPSSVVVAWSAEALWLFVVWAYWVDNHRLPNRN